MQMNYCSYQQNAQRKFDEKNPTPAAMEPEKLWNRDFLGTCTSHCVIIPLYKVSGNTGHGLSELSLIKVSIDGLTD